MLHNVLCAFSGIQIQAVVLVFSSVGQVFKTSQLLLSQVLSYWCAVTHLQSPARISNIWRKCRWKLAAIRNVYSELHYVYEVLGWVLLMCLQILKECLSLASFAFNKCSYGYMLTCFRKEFNFYISCLSWELPLPHSSSSNTTKEVVSAFSIFWVVFQIILLKGQKLQWCVIVLEFILILRWQYWVDKVLHQQCYW